MLVVMVNVLLLLQKRISNENNDVVVEFLCWSFFVFALRRFDHAKLEAPPSANLLHLNGKYKFSLFFQSKDRLAR